MFGFISVMFPIMFILVFGIIIVSFIKGFSEWSSNNKQPIIPVEVRVISKRISVTHNNSQNHLSTYTTYYVTFEFENNERLELKVPGKEYGLMVEGDTGTLSFQGTRFISFIRK